MLRRLASLVFVLSVAAAPVASESRVVCRYTGEVIVGCPEEQVPEQPTVQGVGCCDRVVTARLDASSVESQRIAAPFSVVIGLSLPQVAVAGRSTQVAVWNAAAPSIGPPIYLTTRALLI